MRRIVLLPAPGRPRGRLISGLGGLRGRSAWTKPVVLVAALAAAGLLVAIPSPEAHAATPSVKPTASAKPCPAADVKGSGDPVLTSNPTDLPAPGGTWHRTFADGLTVPAKTGSWGTASSQTVVYTGDNGGKWVEYPDGWPSTYTDGNPGYQPAQVLSVHDGVLDFCLQSVTVNGQNLPSGANPSPLVTGSSQYQTYGRYTARIKSDAIPNYHAAILLWPVNDNKGACAESDFPETDLAHDTVTAFAHNATTNCQDYSVQDEFDSTTRIYDGAWHTYTQEWGPGFRKYYIDGRPLLDGAGHDASTTNVWDKNERWQLQVEPDCLWVPITLSRSLTC